MNYSELRDTFKSLMNRDDITDAEADRFIGFGTSRVERNLRTALQRKEVEINITPEGDFPIPNDLLAFIRVEDEDGLLQHVSPSEQSRGFYVKINTIKVVNNASRITVKYYAEFPRTVVNDYLPQASAIPDVIIYSSLVYAAIHYIDDRRTAFEDFYNTLKAEIQALSNELDMSGYPAMRNPYEGYL